MMDLEKDIRVYISALPYGSKKLIAEKAGVTRQAVNYFLSGKSNSKRIVNATIDFIEELNNKRKEQLKRAGLL